MKKFIPILVSVIIVFLLVTTNANAKSRRCSLTSAEIDVFLGDIEHRLPVIDQYAEMLVKLLGSEKHLAKIKKDFEKISNRSLVKAENTHLRRAMKSFKIPSEQLFYDYDDQILSEEFLEKITIGGCRNHNGHFPLSDLTPKQMEKSAELMNHIIESLTPVYMLANEKISDDDLEGLRSNVYSIFSRSDHWESFKLPFTFLKKEPNSAYFFIDNKVPNTYVDMLRNYVQFQSIANKYRVDPGWAYYTSTLDSIMVEMAESGDVFSDLDNATPAESGGAASGNADSGDLNFDDLKLPE